jgi:hypothetical protein
MKIPSHLVTEADSLFDLLSAQCADLEALLALARGETVAVQGRNFDELIRITAERATLGERLEVYHRQIAELRQRLGTTAESALQSPSAVRITELVNSVQTQDQQTRPLLLRMREEIGEESKKLNHTARSLTAYLNEGRMPAVACDQLA